MATAACIWWVPVSGWSPLQPLPGLLTLMIRASCRALPTFGLTESQALCVSFCRLWHIIPSHMPGYAAMCHARLYQGLRSAEPLHCCFVQDIFLCSSEVFCSILWVCTILIKWIFSRYFIIWNEIFSATVSLRLFKKCIWKVLISVCCILYPLFYILAWVVFRCLS